MAGGGAIPWHYLDHNMLKMWRWETPHFEASITADLNSFTWEIIDMISAAGDGEGHLLAEGRTGEFPDAEDAVREIVGKSYPAKYGYQEVAGPLATTFTIATGERVNFADFVGHRVVVTVRLPAGTTQSFIGTCSVRHYDLIVTPDSGGGVKIQPSHVESIKGEGGTATNAARAAYTGMGRMYRGDVTRGCTGKPGFMPETVDHHDGPCPIHETHASGYLS